MKKDKKNYQFQIFSQFSIFFKIRGFLPKKHKNKRFFATFGQFVVKYSYFLLNF